MQCIRCGREMRQSTGGNYSCDNCGHAVNDLIFRGYEGSITVPYEIDNNPKPLQAIGSVGWICPKCGRALAPWTSECPCYKVITSNTTTTDISSNKLLIDQPFNWDQ